MRRILRMGGPLLVVICVAVIFSVWHAESKDVLGPMSKFVTYKQNYFIADGPPTRRSTIQTWAWLSAASKPEIYNYKIWLSRQRWLTMGDGFFVEAIRGGDKDGPELLPDENVSLHHSGKDEMLLIYSRKVSPLQAFFYRYSYKNLGYNDPAPSKPPGLGSVGP